MAHQRQHLPKLDDNGPVSDSCMLVAMHSSAERSTMQYRLSLACALHSVSPALSALHVSRAAALHPEVSAIVQPSHCPKCGTYHFSGDHPTHPSARKRRRRAMSARPKALQKKCHLCGFSTDACTNPSLGNSSVPVQLPSSLSKSETVSTTKEIGQESSSADTVPTTTPPLPSRQSQSKSSRIKTSTLRDMLSRDRQREAAVMAHRKRKEGNEGLTAFLKEL